MGILSTERTAADHITLADAPFFLEIMNSPGWLRFIGDRSVSDVAAARHIIQDSYLPVYETLGYGYYVIRERATNRPVGLCGFLKKDYLQYPDFGFAMLPGFEGRGLAREASEAVLAFGRQTFDLQVLDAVTHPDNARSIGLLERLGFLREGSVTPDDGNELLLLRLDTASAAI